MSDIKSYDSIRDLHEDISNLDDLMTDYKHQQQELDMERSVFFEQLQAAVVTYEKQVHTYEEKRKGLDQRQADLREAKEACQQNLDVLQHQLDAKMGVPLSKDNAKNLSNSTKANEKAKDKTQQDSSKGITTQEQIDKLEAQRDKPSIELNMDPPGMNQASRIDQDLNQLIDEKKNKMSESSKDLNKNWNAAKGRKL